MSSSLTNISLKSLVPKAFRKGFFLNFKGRYRIWKGARNTGKSHTIIGFEPIIKIASDPRRNVMMVRLNSNSNRQSTYENLCGRILDLDMGDRFKMVTSPNPEITYKPTGQKIIFRGLNDPTTLNSITFAKGYLTDVYIESVVYKGEHNEIILESDTRKWLMLSDTDEQVATYVPLWFDFSKASFEVDNTPVFEEDEA